MYKTAQGYFKRLIYKSGIYTRMLLLKGGEKRVVEQFHKLYYDTGQVGKTWRNTFFLGVPVQKCPLDLFIYQEILYQVKPDMIIETGTAYGGSALFLATICDELQKGKIFTIDTVDVRKLPEHKRITFLLGSSTDKKIVNKVLKNIKKKDKVMVILDSDHSKKHVLEELKIYSKLVPKGSYLIVEDTNVNGHPVQLTHGPGPMEAKDIFMKNNTDFIIDKSREKFYLTFNPDGYLKRV